MRKTSSPILLMVCTTLLCCVLHTISAYAFAIPKAPSNLAAVAASVSQINLTWTDASTDETGFELESSADGIKYDKIADLKSNTVNYIHDSLKASTRYWYRLRAKNLSGNSAYSNVASATTLAPIITVPKAPSALVATAVSGFQINIGWTDNADNETGLEIESSTDGLKFEKIADVARNTITYQRSGLKPATKYWFRVLAVNTAGKSAYSNTVSAVTMQIPPISPDQLAGTAISQSQINISWSDNSNNESGFQVERSTNGTTFTKIADPAANLTIYQNTGLTAGTLYYYRVRAVNAAGASAYSETISVRTLNIPVPNRPTDFTAVPLAPGLVQLRWAPVTGNATSVVIERARGADENYLILATLPASVIQFQDTSDLEKVDYLYRIKAVNAGGSSPYSLLSIVRASSIITSFEDGQRSNSIYVYGRTLFTNSRTVGKGRIYIYDLAGRKQKEVSSNGDMQIDLNGFAAGIYIVVIETGRKVISKRVGLY